MSDTASLLGHLTLLRTHRDELIARVNALHPGEKRDNLRRQLALVEGQLQALDARTARQKGLSAT